MELNLQFIFYVKGRYNAYVMHHIWDFLFKRLHVEKNISNISFCVFLSNQ